MHYYFPEGSLTSYKITGFENEYALLAPGGVAILTRLMYPKCRRIFHT